MYDYPQDVHMSNATVELLHLVIVQNFKNTVLHACVCDATMHVPVSQFGCDVHCAAVTARLKDSLQDVPHFMF